MNNEVEQDIERVWETFWKEIVTDNGLLNLEKLKKELYDFYYVMEQVPKVYSHITGNMLSKIMYKAETVINAADEHYESLYEEDDEV